MTDEKKNAGLFKVTDSELEKVSGGSGEDYVNPVKFDRPPVSGLYCPNCTGNEKVTLIGHEAFNGAVCPKYRCAKCNAIYLYFVTDN